MPHDIHYSQTNTTVVSEPPFRRIVLETAALAEEQRERKWSVSREAYVGFSATAGEIEVQGDPQVFKCLQVVAKAFSRKLPEGVLVPLGCLLHLPFLEDTWRADMQ